MSRLTTPSVTTVELTRGTTRDRRALFRDAVSLAALEPAVDPVVRGAGGSASDR
ncbi:hypothetical protein L1785_03300 [Antribacter sp. KLBMP9083]|uniref:Uncharacterized protein n=1 Tax=Antribacter soli TaxID=2910976 RepID=A0AA41QBC6_9MICO|nr:hypothetical protein [Antribacter soli]MCF4119996.1 hypothetical protein [Antribacter soli]